MKSIGSIARSFLPSPEPKVVHYIAGVGGWKKLERPMMSSDLSCLVCGSYEYYAVFCYPEKSDERVRICAKGDCVTNTSMLHVQATSIQPRSQRAILWPKFCESNGIGDVHHGVRFELIEQSSQKIDYMSKFCQKPSGLIYMQGDTGSGKTYSAMAMCELFTRAESSCMFMTQVRLRDEWLKMIRGEGIHFINRVNEVNLLVIDDFGTGEVTPAFLSYFMELMNSRLQWTDRGTVITTNLSDAKLSEFCGDALTDRLRTGQLFIFQGNSKRIRKAL